jgi:SRSO17 transposase
MWLTRRGFGWLKWQVLNTRKMKRKSTSCGLTGRIEMNEKTYDDIEWEVETVDLETVKLIGSAECCEGGSFRFEITLDTSDAEITFQPDEEY